MAADVVRAEEGSALGHGYAYDVFLSFRGTDTRKSFTDHLYTALVNAGFRTFRDDDEIPRGEEVKSELHRAIRQSRVSIVVFSKDYASSTWCLDELVTMLDHRATSKSHVVLPVFYGVDPSEVRKQKGRVKKAFERHRGHERSHQWRTALTQAADLAGFTSDGLESELIQKIVRVIEDKLRQASLSVEPHLVGIHSRAKEINMWLQDGSTDVGITLICGIGGIGKTTVAKYVYNLNFQNFEAATFLSNIREISKQPNGLVCLQRQLLSNILRGKHEKIYSIDEGNMKIKDAISCRRILLVLDDVDPKDQLLEAIIGMRKWFYMGSKIIITSKQERLLKANEVCKVHKIEILNNEESLNLFSWHTFGQDHPSEACMEYSKEVVHYCGGLPLALKVLGRSLSGRSADIWKSALKKLRVVLDNDIFEKLKISFDSLQDDQDESIFLHIACFFVEKDKDCVVGILDKCNLFTAIGIQNLIDRCLLTINKNNKVVMHQLIRDMGREIVRRESPNECGKRSRLWHHMDSFNVLKEKTGTETIEGLSLNMDLLLNQSKEDILLKQHRFAFLSRDPIITTSRNYKEEVEIDAFSMMRKLRLLELSAVQLTGSYKEFPKRLRWLCWQGFPLNSMPTDFPIGCLVALEMPHSNLKEVWRGTKYFVTLKFLNLSHSQSLLKTTNFSKIPNLERLNLEGCKNLLEVDESIGDLNRLVLVNLKDCINLRGLPKSIWKLEVLEILTISGCSKLKGLSVELGSMESLRVFEADGTDMGELLSGIEGVKPWHWFTWSYASKPPRKIREISWACLPRSLVSLSLADCNLSAEDFPRELSNLCMLKELNLSRNPIVCLPHCVRGLSRLEELKVRSCTRLQSLVGPLQLRSLNVSDCPLLLQIISIDFRCVVINLRLGIVVELHNAYRLQPISKIDPEMVKYLGLLDLMGSPRKWKRRIQVQGISESSVFSICLPGYEIPVCFSSKVKGCFISFAAPSNVPNSNIRGLNVCSVITLSGQPESLSPPPLFTKICNKSKGWTWVYGPSYYGVPEEDSKHMIWLSHWKFGDELEAGDEVNVCVIVGVGFQVAECGIKLVYHHEYDDDEAAEAYNPFAGWTRIIGGDLSGAKRKGAYLLCNDEFITSAGPNYTFVDFEEIQSGWCKQLFEKSTEATEAEGTHDRRLIVVAD